MDGLKQNGLGRPPTPATPEMAQLATLSEKLRADGVSQTMTISEFAEQNVQHSRSRGIQHRTSNGSTLARLTWPP